MTKAGGSEALAKMRARTSSFPDVSGQTYQVFQEEASTGSMMRVRSEVLGSERPPAPGPESGPVARPSNAPLAAWTLVFAAMAVPFAWIASAPTWLVGGLAGVAVLSAIVFAATRNK